MLQTVQSLEQAPIFCTPFLIILTQLPSSQVGDLYI